jgi:Sulfotransferase domain
MKAFLKYLKIQSIERELLQKKRERSQIARELRVAKRGANRSERLEQGRRIKSKQQEIFRLENKLRSAKARTEDSPETGSLPDFVIIGAPKCGTTFLYHLLTQHPHVEPGAFKEVHYFDLHFDKGTDWYRQCFPVPLVKNGRTTITGEATPGYLSFAKAPERMAEVIPRAALDSAAAKPG